MRVISTVPASFVRANVSPYHLTIDSIVSHRRDTSRSREVKEEKKAHRPVSNEAPHGRRLPITRRHDRDRRSRDRGRRVTATWRGAACRNFWTKWYRSPMDGVIHGGGCSLGGRCWVDTGWLRRRKHRGGERVLCLPFGFSFDDYGLSRAAPPGELACLLKTFLLFIARQAENVSRPTRRRSVALLIMLFLIR